MTPSLGRRARELVHPLLRRVETSVHPLRYLFLEVTQRCNLACLHCGSDCGRARSPGELSTQEWLALLDGLAERVDRKKLLLVLTGGEPLCHPDLDLLLERLSLRGLAFGVVTNGHDLTRDRARQLAARGARSLTISLDGLEEAHDWLRGRTGAFARALRAIEAAVEVGFPFLDVVTCVSPRNLGELGQVRALLERLGVRAWRLFSIFPKGRARGNRALLLSPAELRALLDFIAVERRRVHPGALDLQYGCEGFLPAELDRAVRREPYFCRAGISIGSVLADGSISACPNISRSLVQGNVRQDDLLDVWEHRFQRFRDRAWMQTGRCERCEHFPRCAGNSMHLWDDAAGQTALCTHQVARGEEPDGT